MCFFPRKYLCLVIIAWLHWFLGFVGALRIVKILCSASILISNLIFCETYKWDAIWVGDLPFLVSVILVLLAELFLFLLHVLRNCWISIVSFHL